MESKLLEFIFYSITLAVVLNLIANMVWKYIPKTRGYPDIIISAALIGICVLSIIFFGKGICLDKGIYLYIIIFVVLIGICVLFIIFFRKKSRREDKKKQPVKNYITLPEGKISLAKMPTTSPDVFGREKELAMLDKAWNSEHKNIVMLVAFGGVGKTALVNKWLNNMELDDYRGAERVLGWTFYSQGSRQDGQASADQFIASALRWFGDTNPDEGSAWDKGERLAQLVRKEKTLLVLDGLEPLQNPADCRLRDQSLKSLLKELSHQNPGLCVITTRLSVDDIKDHIGTSVEEIELENLSQEAGAKLLEKLGAKGLPDELKKAVDDLKGHALAVTLLGTYLKIVHHGDIRMRKEIPKLMTETKLGEHTKHIMESYENWFRGKPELDILYIMGLFDRSAEGGAIQALRKKPVIKGLTDQLLKLSQEKWQFALDNLRTARLLSDENKNKPDDLDCHSLVREHFGEKLKANNPKAWKEAHSRLCEWYKSQAEEYPSTIKDMEPLLVAVAHGCQAERYSEMLEIYENRINRTEDNGIIMNFLRDKLGAVSADLTVLSHFFDKPWNTLVDKITDKQKAFILSISGLVLYTIGRLKDSIQPRQKGLEICKSIKELGMAAQCARHLSETFLPLGDLIKAEKYATDSVSYAESSWKIYCQKTTKSSHSSENQKKELYYQVVTYATLAYILHHKGCLEEARSLFIKAEQIQKQMEPGFPLLCRLHGSRYFDLLLDLGEQQTVIEYTERTLEWPQQENYPLAKALHRLALCRAYLLNGNLLQAEKNMDIVINDLRQAGQPPFLIPGILTRAELYRLSKEFKKAQQDIDNSLYIVDFCEMNLYKADCHLEYTKLYLAMSRKEEPQKHLIEAQKHLDTAKNMIDDMGYHRRDADCYLEYARLYFYMNDKDKAQENFVKAKEIVEKVGYHCLDKEVQELEKQMSGTG